MRRRTLVQASFSRGGGDLGRKVVHGALIQFAGIALRIAITIGSTAVLARLLSPRDFGHVAMATVVTELAALLSQFGFGSILVQRWRITRLQLDTVYWTSAAIGVALALGIFLFSRFAEAVFADPVPRQLLAVLAIAFLLSQLESVPYAVLNRLMMFRHALGVDAISLAARALTAIGMAHAGFGVWSLVGGALGGTVAGLIAVTLVVRFVPRLRFDARFLRETWRINGSYFGNGVVFYLNMNVDLLIVGRSLGATALGFYQNARSLTDEIRARVANPLQRVLFPAFAALQDDEARFRQGVLRSSRLVALAVLPIGFGIAAVAPELVPVLYGDKWLAMIPIVQIVSPGAGLRAASATSTSVFNATNRVGLSFRLNAIACALLVATMFAGSLFGLTGVAVALLVTSLFGVVIQRFAFAQVGIRGGEHAAVLWPPLVAAATMAVAIHLVRPYATAWLPAPFPRLFVLVAFGALAYAAILLAIAPNHRGDMLAVLQRLFPRRR